MTGEPDNVTIISDKAGNESHHYTLLWNPEYSGGCNVTGYNIEYAKVSTHERIFVCAYV